MTDSIDIEIRSSFRDTGVKAAEAAFQKLQAAQQKAASAAQKALASPGDAKLANAALKAASAAQRAETAYLKAAQAGARLASASGDAAGAVNVLSTAMGRVDKSTTQAVNAQVQLQRALNATDKSAREAAGGAAVLPRTLEKFGAGAVGQLKQVAAGFVGVEAALRAVDFAGSSVQLANSTAQADAALRALAGSPALYAQALEAARQQQVLFGGSLQENISGIQGLITVSRDSGLELSKLIDLSQRLAVKDPAQGAAGARIALQEAFSGDPTSLAKRYEIPKAALAALRDESISAGEKLAILDTYLNKIGITSEVASGSVTKSAQQINALAQAAEAAQLKLGAFLAPMAGDTAEGATQLLNLATSGEDANTALSNLAGSLATYLALGSGAGAASDGFGASVDSTTAKLLEWIGVMDGATAAQQGKIGVDIAAAAAQEQVAAATLAMGGATNSVIEGLLAERDAKIASEQEAQRLASTQERLATLGAQVHGGMITAAQGAAILAAQYGVTAAEAAYLIQLQAQIAGGQARIAAQKSQTRELVPGGVGVSSPGKRGSSDADILATVNKTTEEITAVGVRAQTVRTAAVKTGGGARASAEQSAADKIKAIAQQTADKLVAIDERAAQQRAAAMRSLATAISTSSADMVASQEANDLELVGASEDRLAELSAREQAEATARISAINAVKEARAIADAGDAERAQAVLEQRTQQIQSQQSLDEEYAKRRAELAGDPAATEALKTQYDEATAALADATQVRIDLAAQEAAQRVEALAAEKQAVLDSASAQAAALGTTGSAADTAAGRVNALTAAINSIPLAKTVTINVVETGGGGKSSAPASSGGGGDSAKMAGGGVLTGVTSGPMTVTLGDNPGGVEAYAISATPLSGKGQSTATAGNLRLAGGTGTSIGGASDEAVRRLEDANRRAIIPTAGGGAASGSTKGAAQRAAKEEKAAKPAIADYAKAAKENLDILAETLKLRTIVQDPATWMPINDAVLESAARDADKVARAFADIAATYDGPVLEAAKLYSDALGGAFSVISDGLETFDRLRGSDILDLASLKQFEQGAMATIDTVGRLGAQAATIPESSASALGNIAATLAVLPALGMLGGGGGSNTDVGGVNIAIYQQPGQDSQALVRQVMQAINTQMGARR